MSGKERERLGGFGEGKGGGGGPGGAGVWGRGIGPWWSWAVLESRERGDVSAGVRRGVPAEARGFWSDPGERKAGEVGAAGGSRDAAALVGGGGAGAGASGGPAGSGGGARATAPF